jgi:hypothetical protein
MTRQKEIFASKYMNNSSSTIVQRLWNYRNVLRDDGISYGDYVEQLTDLLFLKMDRRYHLSYEPAFALPWRHTGVGEHPSRRPAPCAISLGERETPLHG